MCLASENRGTVSEEQVRKVRSDFEGKLKNLKSELSKMKTAKIEHQQLLRAKVKCESSVFNDSYFPLFTQQKRKKSVQEVALHPSWADPLDFLVLCWGPGRYMQELIYRSEC